MKKVTLFVNRDITYIDLGQDPYYCEVVEANVLSITRDGNGYVVATDYTNPYSNCKAQFFLSQENFAKLQLF